MFVFFALWIFICRVKFDFPKKSIFACFTFIEFFFREFLYFQPNLTPKKTSSRRLHIDIGSRYRGFLYDQSNSALKIFSFYFLHIQKCFFNVSSPMHGQTQLKRKLLVVFFIFIVFYQHEFSYLETNLSLENVFWHWSHSSFVFHCGFSYAEPSSAWDKISFCIFHQYKPMHIRTYLFRELLLIQLTFIGFFSIASSLL